MLEKKRRDSMKYGKQKRTAVVIVAVVVMILCIAAFKMPYPFTIEADGIIVNNNLPGRENYAICMLVPYRYKEFLQGERPVVATFEGRDDVSINSSIVSVSHQIVKKSNENFFEVYVQLADMEVDYYDLYPGMKVHVVISVDDTSIIRRIAT
ncbi:hypothetical protein [Prevotella aff. ruminicola Tc2-24]|nr:hypothetical protein [Prevotella aff. ruminicola Tc2-24]